MAISLTRKTLLSLGAAAVVVLLHLAVVISVAKQPLNLSASPEQRSVIWKYHHDTVHRSGPGSDFFAIVHAAIQQARDESPYDTFEDPQVTPHFNPFRYLPIVAQTLGRAATWFSGRTSYVIWCVLLELLLAGTLIVIWRVEAQVRWKLGLSTVLLLSSPYFLELHMGQFTFASCALLAMGLALLDRTKKSYSIGGTAAFVGAVLLKMFPLAAGAALILRRKGLIAATVAGGLVAASALPYFIANPAEWQAFAAVNLGETGVKDFNGGNYGFLYMVYLASGSIGGEAAEAALLSFARSWQLLVLGISVVLVLWKKPTILTGGVTLTLAHMISYKHVWEHHASGALVLAVFLLLRLKDDRAWIGRWIALASLIALALPTPFVFIDALDPTVNNPALLWGPFWRFALASSKGLPMFALWVLGAVHCYREGRANRIVAVAADNATVDADWPKLALAGHRAA
jgi:hypothetical protein